MIARPGREIFINGRFLSQSVTGVQRYAGELVKALDRLVASGQVPDALKNTSFTLLAPPNVLAPLPLTAIGYRQIGRLKGHAWDQIELAGAARRGVLVSLSNAGPVLHRRHFIILHDAQVYRHPEFFSRGYLTLHRTLGRLYARVAHLGTVSAFSRGELAQALHLPPERFSVIPNSAEHITNTVPDSGVLARLGLTSGRFFLAVGSMTRNKNIALAIEASRLLARPDYPLVVVGGGNHQVFGKGAADHGADAIMAGRRSDEEIAGLYQHATAFVFPSLYEGFGVPPLEAMSFGCPVLASTAGAVVETCGDAARYFDPHDAATLGRLMQERIDGQPPLAELQDRQKARIARFSWEASAKALLACVAGIAA